MELYDNFREGGMVEEAGVDTVIGKAESPGAKIRGISKRGRRAGTKTKNETVEQHLLSQWGWGSASTDSFAAPPSKSKDKSKDKSKSTSKSSFFWRKSKPKPDVAAALQPSAVIPKAAAAKGAARESPKQEPNLSQAETEVHLEERSIATLKPRLSKRDTPVGNRPPRSPLPSPTAAPVDFYVAYHPHDEALAMALADHVEARAHRADDTGATIFLDVKTLRHLRIGDTKWRKKSLAERLGRLREAKVFVCLISDAALSALRLAHTEESVLLWEIEIALEAGHTVVPLLLAAEAINIAAFSRQPAFHPLGRIDARAAVSELLRCPPLRPRGDFIADLERIVLELGACLRGNPIKADVDVEEVVVDDDDAAAALEEVEAETEAEVAGADMPPPSKLVPKRESDPMLESNELYGDPADDSEDIEHWGHWQLDREQVTQANKIGEGEFGEVMQGHLHGTGKHEGMKADVAVKVQTKGSRLEFLQEARTMVQLHHPNLVNIYGVCTTAEPVLIVSELCAHGSLKSFLPSHQAKSLIVSDIRQMIREICTAMAFVSSEGIIHRDLAARNVLVEEPLRCKIADFGMAVEVGDDGVFHADRSQPVPIRWSSPEAILYGQFSSKSDVWSFGILIYEIVTFANEIYAGVSNKDVVQMVCKEYTRLPCPTMPRARLGCSKKLHEVMLSCWGQEPADRPSFNQLLEAHLPAASC